MTEDTFLVVEGPDREVRVVETQTIWTEDDGYAKFTKDVCLTIWRQAGLIGDDGYAKVVTDGAFGDYNGPSYEFADELVDYWEEKFLAQWAAFEASDSDADSVEQYGHHFSEEAYQKHDGWYEQGWVVLGKYAPPARHGEPGSGVEVAA